jgi:hypothetical protein
MIEILEQLPNQFFTFDNDAEVKMLLFEVGIVDKLSKNLSASVQAVIFAEHPTHHIIGMRFVGMEMAL